MEGWKLDDMRRRAGRGEALTAPETLALIDALARARRAAALPAEFLVRVARSEDDVDCWTASHPLLRSSPTASHPGDALALASVELRRALSDREWPSSDWRTVRVERAVADAHAASETVAAPALRWALDRLDAVTAELHDERSHAVLRSSAAAGDRDARDRLRAESVARLERAGVVPCRSAWGPDGFGDASDVDLAVPCLVLAMPVRESDDLDGLRFDSSRSWYALHHRIVPRPLSQYRKAVVSPLALNAVSDLALRRIAPRIRTGHSVGTYCAYRDLFVEELPGVEVDSVVGQLFSRSTISARTFGIVAVWPRVWVWATWRRSIMARWSCWCGS